MSVTDEDLERAQSVLGWGGLSEDYLRADELTQRNAIAAALAAEREKARAPFLALAATWIDCQEMTAGGRIFRHCGRAIQDIAEDS